MKDNNASPLIQWPKAIVKPQEPMDPRRPTLYEVWAVNGRVEPYGA